MKIQGRFIAILAVLGLLMALVPLATAGAVAGEVTIEGGAADGQYFSDQTDNNIVTVSVEDADLTPLRIGTARSATVTGTDLNLKAFVVGGEKDKTERFHGGTTNGPCHPAATDSDNDPATDARYDGNGTAPDATATPPVAAVEDTSNESGGTPAGDSFYHVGCPDVGAVTVMQKASDGTITAIANNAVPGTETDQIPGPSAGGITLVYRFTLEGVARDRQANGTAGVGVLGTNDLVSVVVNGRSATADANNDAGSANPGGSGPWFTVAVVAPDSTVADPTDGTIPAGWGGGIKEITLHRVAPRPQVTEDSISVTYKETEFKFASETPLEYDDTRVRTGGTTETVAGATVSATDFNDVRNRVGVNGVGGFTVTVPGTPAITGASIITFAYDVKDTEKDIVVLNSASAGDRKLTGVETAADSDTFEAKVAVFTQEDYSTITTESKNTMNDDGTDADNVVISIGELNATNGLSGTDDTDDRSLWVRVQRASENLGMALTDPAADFVAKIIPARDGDVIKATYSDVNPTATVSDSATVDLAAPVVTLVSPSDKFFTSTRTVTMSAEVVDDGAGVNEVDINLIVVDVSTSGINLGSQVKTPITDGYRVTMVPEGTITEGTKEWFVGVEDKVGNIPAMDNPDTEEINEAPKGAGAPTAADADNPYKFTIDTRAPSLSTGVTGVSLKDPGVTKGEDKETERTNQRTWVKVVFNVGDGGAPLDPATVTASDFEVDGLSPLDAKINSVTHGDDATGTAVYLQVGQLDTDARPKVELVDVVADKAGNEQDEGTIATVNDGLKPKLTVTPSAELAKDTVTVTVSSSENLRSNPTIGVTETKPVMGTASTTTPLAVSLQTGSLTTWTATFRNTPGQASRQYVVVTGIDLAENSDTVGDASVETDLVSFQVDDAEPQVLFKDAAGNDLEDSKQTEGAVWLVAEYDEDEHADDKSRKVTVTAVTLTDTDSEEVVTDDVNQVFGSEVTCDDHDADADDDPVPQDKCAQRTLAVNLTPGMYNIAMTGVDASGNEVSDDVDFEVIEAEPFELVLRPGQNFISIPGMPMGDGGNIDTLLADEAISSISTYDRSRELEGESPWLRSTKDLETGMFSGDITAIEPGKAYFINSTASVTLEVKLQGAGELPPTIPVRQGFNAIGFWSVSGDTSAEIDLYLGSIGWTVAYSYDPTPGVGWQVIRRGQLDANDDPLRIEEGKGYLVYALYDSVLTP